jgi:hypothetical protein
MGDNLSTCSNSVFEQGWWLDIVAPHKWKEILILEENKILARWPIVESWSRVKMPKMTQTLGFWLSETEFSNDPCYKKRKRITNLLLDKLPKNKSINIRLDHKVDYFLPMHWRHFIISPCISYRMDDLTNLNSIFDKFDRRVKENIKCATKKLIIKDIDNIDPLILLLDKTYKIQKRKNPNSAVMIRNIYNSSKEHNSGKLLYAVSEDGVIHSGGFFVYNEKVCHYLLTGSDPKYRSSGANSLIVWEGIKFAATVSKAFDFEGSMIEGIENFFRQFGGRPSVYYKIRKQYLLFDIFDLLKPRIKTLIRYKQ